MNYLVVKPDSDNVLTVVTKHRNFTSALKSFIKNYQKQEPKGLFILDDEEDELYSFEDLKNEEFIEVNEKSGKIKIVEDNEHTLTIYVD
jgi:hypothetical protein